MIGKKTKTKGNLHDFRIIQAQQPRELNGQLIFFREVDEARPFYKYEKKSFCTQISN